MFEYAAPINALEDRLRDAMLKSDVAALDSLIADELIFTNPAGALLTKEMDLEAHRSGAQRMHSILPSEQQVLHYGDTAIVNVKALLSGSFEGLPFSGEFRYTRVWHMENGHWRVVAGHCSPIVNA